jgi:hypothetical protein
MKAKVDVPVTTTTVEEMELDFPIYRKVESKQKFMRVTMVGDTMKEVAVQLGKNGSAQIKIRPYAFEDMELDYLLGLGDYTSDESEFLSAVRTVSNTLASVAEEPNLQ